MRQMLKLPEHFMKLSDCQSIIVPINTFDPEPFELCKEIMVVVQPDGNDSFVATFFDGNINASGNTQVDAVANLKDMMILLYERLSKEKKSKLGKVPTRQLAVLREVLMRRE